MSSIKTTQIDGDVSVGRNVAMGGDATVQGNSLLKGHVRVLGWLDAPNIKHPNKGLFASEEKLNEAYPNPKNGWYAFVGDKFPAAIYRAWDGKWEATGETGWGDYVTGETTATGGDDSSYLVTLTNNLEAAEFTSYFDASCLLDFTFTSKHYDSEAEDYVEITESGVCMVIVTNSTYTTPTVVKQFEISSGSGTTLDVLEYLKEGSNTIKLVVLGETSSKVATLTYTVTYEEEEEVVYTDFLERSDLPGTYYSTVQSAFDAVVADYPDGLTQDVTITCIADNVTTSRTSDTYIAEISDWNKDTLYTLTLDGNSQLTMDCKSLGGIYLSFVDNFHCKNISFVDVTNNIGTYSPEETAAIRFDGNVESYSRNLLVENCKIDGQYDTSDKFGYYGVDCKYAENIYVCNTSFTSMYVIPLKFTDCKMVSLIKNYVDASLSNGIIGHPALCTFTTGSILIAEDNTFTGTTGEYAFYIKNVDYMYFRRNSFHDIGGEAIRFASNSVVKEFVLESNLFYNVLSAPSVTWAFNYIVFECDVEYVNINGNTVHANGSQWQQWFLRAGDVSVDTMNFYNNIISSGLSSSKPFYSIQMGTVTTLNSGYNLYRLALKDTDTASMNIFNAGGLSSTNSLTSLQSQGVETGSWLISNSESIFQSESGSSAYKLLSSLASTYAADADHLPSIDIEYLEAAASGNNIGCYNLAGTAIDETVDEAGYEGYDVDRELSFSSEALYDTYAECILLLMHKTRNRSRIVRFKAVGSQHSVLILGRYGIIQPYPVLDDNGEYVEDEYYDINIE